MVSAFNLSAHVPGPEKPDVPKAAMFHQCWALRVIGAAQKIPVCNFHFCLMVEVSTPSFLKRWHQGQA